MKTSENGIDQIKVHEGLKLEAYQDAVGVWTIGYGHTGPDVHPGKVVSEEEAEDMLRGDLAWAEDAVSKGVAGTSTTQNQFDAFVSLAFNIGAKAFAGSTALKRHNKRDHAGAADAITWWNKAGGRVLAGLVRRRFAEKALYLTPVAEGGTCEA